MIESLDHLVLTVKDIEATCRFYQRVLAMEVVTFRQRRKALRFGQQKINLHQYQAETNPALVAVHVTPGAGDLCFLTKTPVADVIAHLRECGVEIEAGPVERTGAVSPLLSVYFRDPDGNLLEVSNRLET
jgi:catechol 2,3-dioxygenase-like lactoylglutathione lyase family enzyme